MVTGAEMQGRLLLAIDNLVTNKKDNPIELTKEFWDALAPFVNEVVTGKVDFIEKSDGSISIEFTPKRR